MVNLWIKSTMNKLCEITSSKRIFAAEYQTDGVPFYRGKEITEKHKGSLDVSTELFISRRKFLEIKNKFGAPKQGDLLLTSVGTLGMPYVVKRNEEFYFKDGNLTWFRNFIGLDSRFLYYWLLSPQGKGELKKATIGSSQSAYTIVLLKEMVVTLPPLETQRKIATILSTYDDLIENNTRRIKILEEMAQTIYREWFVNFRFPGHEQVKLVDSPLGKIPEGWEVKPVTESIEVKPRTKVTKEGEKPFAPMGSLSTNSMLISNVETKAGNSGAKFKNGDTLFARITPCLENGKTGFVQFLPDDETTAFGSTEFIVLRSKALCPEYVYLMARSNEFRDNAIKSMSGATGRQRVSEKCFDQFFIAQPSQKRLDIFSSHVAPMFRKVHVLAKKNENLRQTRDLLLPKLISGAVDVVGIPYTNKEEC
ncbi:MAG: restriction endonuclease subunit S [Desulfuromonas sp.]|nr:restriction endonuclease subunit S [Desulfuromonas sp.]